MAQQPNIQLHVEDLPRPTAHPAAPRRWSPQRPGELASPEDMPWGGMYGTPGPDSGYAYRLLADVELPLADGEHRQDAVAGLAALAAARASHFGRAPAKGDVEVARLLVGLSPDGLPDAVVSRLAADRQTWMGGLAHDPAGARLLVAAVPLDALTLEADEIRSRMAGGERLVKL